jgi:hypothetical protein
LLSPSLALARANELPDGELTFFNVRTDERLKVRYRDDAGNYDLMALDEVNHILRCHHTGEVAAIDVRMLEHVNLVQNRVGSGNEIHVISGYRSPEYNAQLVKRSRRVAQHSLGWASTREQNSSISIAVLSGPGKSLLLHYSCAVLLHSGIRCCGASPVSRLAGRPHTGLATCQLNWNRKVLPQDAQKADQQARSE